MTKEEAIDLLDNLIGFVEDNHGSDYDEALKIAIEALEQNPKTGHWIYLKNERKSVVQAYKCSVCGWEIDSCRGLMQDTGYRLFCEHCGAKMRSEE